ncbi:uncharacterized protein METZ01_LOCUS479336, partial [marine metagenome]
MIIGNFIIIIRWDLKFPANYISLSFILNPTGSVISPGGFESNSSESENAFAIIKSLTFFVSLDIISLVLKSIK